MLYFVNTSVDTTSTLHFKSFLIKFGGKKVHDDSGAGACKLSLHPM